MAPAIDDPEGLRRDIKKGQHILVGITHIKLATIRHHAQWLDNFHRLRVTCSYMPSRSFTPKIKSTSSFFRLRCRSLLHGSITRLEMNRVRSKSDAGIKVFVPEVDLESQLPGVEFDRPTQVGHDEQRTHAVDGL